VASVRHEVPLPPPEKPERERRRSPAYEAATIAVGEAGAWVADIHRSARDFARCKRADVAITIEFADGRRVAARDLRTGPGEGFVTLCEDARELSVRLETIRWVELAPVTAGGTPFRLRESGFGFG